MNPNHQYDVIIIGTGAGGGTLAQKLAPSGKRILLLERGGYVQRERDNWSSLAVNVQGKYQTKEVWRDRDGKDLHPHTNYCVGGNTKFYGAALFRLRERDFGELRHHGGVSPAWPISYNDLEPYYAAAESLYQVHGNRGEDPCEPRASGPYPHAAVSHEPRMQQLSEDFAASGLRPFHTPLGIMLDESDPQRSKCIRCNTCDGYPCLLFAKSDAQVLGVDRALGFPNVHLKTHAKVDRLETSESGREITRVVVNGETFSAGVVVVSCGAINSAALLLRSRMIAIRTARELVRRGGPPLHGPHEFRADGGFEVSEPHRVPEDAFGQRLLLPWPRIRLSDGAHFVRRQVRWNHAFRRSPGDRAWIHARPDGAPLARFLAHF